MDYKKINLKVGLEIHQELSRTKLFCSCSTDLKEKNKVVEITRKIRPSRGETGEIDIASLYEKEKNKEFVYYGYEDEYCLVEMDSEPPHEINLNALKTALAVATLLKLKIPDTLCVMRKVITDGSVVSGFQRSILTGVATKDSYIETSQGKVRIKDIYLEEDAAKIIKKEGNKVYFSLSRAGIPLLEIGTNSDIKTPEHAKETAEKIGMILRSFPTVKRGLGTIRQDVNLSIKGGARVEIKGFQDLRKIPRIIKNEIKRQLKIRVKPEVRRANPDGTTTFLRPLPGSARLYPETDLETINPKPYLKKIKLPKLITDKVAELEKKYKLSKEIAKKLVDIDFSGYVKKFNKVESRLIAQVLVEIPKDIKKRYNLEISKLKQEDFNFVLDNLNKGNINRDAVINILTDKIKNKKINLSDYKAVSKKDLKKGIKKIVNENKGASLKALMGIIMKKYRTTAEGHLVMSILKKYYKEDKTENNKTK